jgi:hypothetical protein
MRLCAHSLKWQQRPDTLVQKCPSTVKCQRFAGFADCSTRCLKALSKASLPERTCGFFYWNLIESYRRYKFSHVRGLFSPLQLRAVPLGPFGHRRHHCLCSRPASLERVSKVSGQMLSLSLAGTKAVLNMDVEQFAVSPIVTESNPTECATGQRYKKLCVDTKLPLSLPTGVTRQRISELNPSLL